MTLISKIQKKKNIKVLFHLWWRQTLIKPSISLLILFTLEFNKEGAFDGLSLDIRRGWDHRISPCVTLGEGWGVRAFGRAALLSRAPLLLLRVSLSSRLVRLISALSRHRSFRGVRVIYRLGQMPAPHALRFPFCGSAAAGAALGMAFFPLSLDSEHRTWGGWWGWVASLSSMAARLCSGNDPYSCKNPAIWGRVPALGWCAPLPILLLYWSSRGIGWDHWPCKLFPPICKKKVCRGIQAINLHLWEENKLKTLKQFIAFYIWGWGVLK